MKDMAGNGDVCPDKSGRYVQRNEKTNTHKR
jgi:hypothetical protein